MCVTDDRRWMAEALGEAARAAALGEVPVGAVIVAGRRLIGRGHNMPITAADPTAHAEIRALRQAARRINNYRIVGATVYATLEPCPMCMGALLHARVKCVVFGCRDPKGGAAGSVYDLATDGRLNHRVEVRAGVGEPESRRLLQVFFQGKRRRSVFAPGR